MSSLPYIDPGVTVTEDQKAIIDKYQLEVMLTGGHVWIRDHYVQQQFGRASGQRIFLVTTDEMDKRLNELAEVHELAQRHAQGQTVQFPQIEELAHSRRVAEVRRHVIERATREAVREVKPSLSREVKPTKQKSATPTRKSGGGVIASLIQLLQNGRYSREELYDELAKEFPDRASPTGGMRSTISVQLNRLKTQGHNVQNERDGAKLVYFIK